MRLHEIIDTDHIDIDFDKITPELSASLLRILRRPGAEPMTPEMLGMMYGHNVERDSLEREKLRAEIDKIKAAAAQDRAAACLS